MLGRRRSGAAPRTAGPRHASGGVSPRVPLRGLALLVAGGVAASSAAVLLAGSPASAEASKTTATLTLLGIRDSNCDLQTGGTTAYVAPGGDVTFKAELAGLSVNVPVLGTIPLSSSKITSFKDTLILDGHKKHPHTLTGSKNYTITDVRANHSIAWSAESIQVTVPVLGGILGAVTGHKSISVPLNLETVTGLPAGAKLNWVGLIVASSKTQCGIAEVPGVGASVGPVHISVPPVTNLPSQPDLGNITSGLPIIGGGGGSSSGHPGGGSSSSAPAGGGSSGGGNYPGLPTQVPARVVPNAGGGGDSAFQYSNAGAGGVQALPDAGSGVNVDPQALSDPSAGGSSPRSDSPSASTPVDLATDSTDGGLGGAQLPVLLAIVAIIALSLVTAAYARMYLLRRPSA